MTSLLPPSSRPASIPPHSAPVPPLLCALCCYQLPPTSACLKPLLDIDALREPRRRPSSNPPRGILKTKSVPTCFSAPSTSPVIAVSSHGTTATPPPRAPYRLHAAPRCASQRYRPTVRPITFVPLRPICTIVDRTRR
jgi:hypothetical protein